ncbi:MAG: hypothetical protein RIQ60_1213 [Pseudomonadota bacterium]|jgi:hypothetical protein
MPSRRVFLSLWLGCSLLWGGAPVLAQTAQQAAVADAAAALVPFNSPEGYARLARASAHADFAALVNQFEPQSNGIFCGPTSSAIVLNALMVGHRPELLPRDGSRLSTEEREWLLRRYGPRADPTVARHTQESVIARGAKPRAVVLGEPPLPAIAAPTASTSVGAASGVAVAPPSSRPDFGYQLRQLDQMLRANGAVTRLVVVDDQLAEATVRQDLVANLQRPGDYVVVNYRRELVGQPGGGHISPLGAYDALSDSFLVLDVNPGAAGWMWIPAAVLIRAMRSFDTVENRGYVEVLAPS